MFDDFQSEQKNVSQIADDGANMQSQEPVDMFGDRKLEKATSLRPVQNVTQEMVSLDGVRRDNSDAWENLSPQERAALESIRPSVWRKVVLWLIIIIAVAGLVYIAWKLVPWGSLSFNLGNVGAIKDQSNAGQDNIEGQNSGGEEENYLNQVVQPGDNNVIPDEVKDDSDRDGLSDEEEKQLGTNLNEPDTDKDGLSDQAEVKTYETDPLKADSDSDGYDDGFEVRNGSNPLDATPDAKLLQIDSEAINEAIPAN